MDYIVGFVVLLGVLVFIHEFGHFYVAKLCGMRVDVFSIGMGKKIFSFTKGETEYALSIFPLGGYVKILGQDPREEVPAHLEHRSFRNKSYLQKCAVVLAGPIANLILAFVVLSTILMAGAPAPAPVLGRVLSSSAAATAGFQSGDLVEAIEFGGRSVKINDLNHLQDFIADKTGKDLIFQVSRPGEESALKVAYTPVAQSVRHPRLGVTQQRGSIEGVEFLPPAASFQVEMDSWLSDFSVTEPFLIQSIEVETAEGHQSLSVSSYFDFAQKWKQAVESQNTALGMIELKGIQIGAEVAKEPDAEPKIESIRLAWNNPTRAPPADIEAAGFRSTELVITSTVEKSPARGAGIQSGDRLVSLNGSEIISFDSFRKRIQILAAQGTTLDLTWVRNGEKISGSLETQKVEHADPVTEVTKERFQIGAAFLALKAPPQMKILKADGITNAFSMGFWRTWDLTSTMVESFYHLFVGNISLKTLGSPLMIAKISGESIKQGWVSFFQMMAFISLNLFILNLLPIPVLDGGHLLLFSVEAIIRRPVSIKVLEVWTTAGVLLLLLIMGVAFFNDFNRFGLFRIFDS